MKTYFLAVMFFAAVVFIIPLSAYYRNQNYLESLVQQDIKISESAAEDVEQSVQESNNVSVHEISSDIGNNDTIYTPKYKCDYFNIYDLTEKKIIKVKAEDYIIGAVAAEMPPSFHAEALKAQAVACHTLAVKLKLMHMDNPDKELWGGDFAADPQKRKGYVTKETLKEMYGDKFELYYGKIKSACDSVKDEIMLYSNEPISAVYHSTSNGFTETAENVWNYGESYLRTVESKGDILSPGYESKAVFTVEEFENLLKTEFPDIVIGKNPEDWISVETRSEGGYVLSLNLGDKNVKGTDARRIFNLRSSDFDVKYENNSFIFTVRGYGHGVGLSQYGADYMARQGKTYEEILKHYYSGIKSAYIK